jgi:hypothetical protein
MMNMTPDEPLDPDEFDRRCAEVRATWSERLERQRRVEKPAEVTVAEVSVHDLGGIEE